MPGMTTSLAQPAYRPVVLAALALAAASAPLGGTALTGAPGTAGAASKPAPKPHEQRSTSSDRDPTSSRAHARPHTYRWPVRPFDRQHPVRGFFGDPRVSNHGRSRQFHFGVDISAPNGTPVYATITGSVFIHPLHRTTVAIVGRDGVEFSYWHVVPTVRTGQRAVAYKTVIGRIEAPYGHVHFSERANGRYLNPLRPGALGPFVDATRPRVASLRVERLGPVALVAEAYDETPLAVPRPWHDLPVMPALLRWRLLDSNGRTVAGWRTATDFRTTIPPATAFDEVWAPGTTQNHVRAPGRYRIYLTRSLSGVRAGAYVVEVSARDVNGNAVVERFALHIASR